MIYFIEDGFNEAIKIGYAARDPYSRLDALQAGNIRELQMLRVIEGTFATESWLHRRYAALHIHGEWYRFDPEMLTVVPPDLQKKKKKLVLQPVPKSIEQMFIEAMRKAVRLGVDPGERLRRKYALEDVQCQSN